MKMLRIAPDVAHSGRPQVSTVLTKPLPMDRGLGHPQRTGPRLWYMRVHSRPRRLEGWSSLGVCPTFAWPPGEPCRFAFPSLLSIAVFDAVRIVIAKDLAHGGEDGILLRCCNG